MISFRAGPNPFISIDDFNKNDIIDFTTADVTTDADATSPANFSNQIESATLKYRTKIIYLIQQQQQQHQPSTYLPSLTTLCLNKLANYDVSYQETKIWKRNVPQLYHQLIKLAITKENSILMILVINVI